MRTVDIWSAITIVFDVRFPINLYDSMFVHNTTSDYQLYFVSVKKNNKLCRLLKYIMPLGVSLWFCEYGCSSITRLYHLPR